jgi:hypothetical protein
VFGRLPPAPPSSSSGLALLLAVESSLVLILDPLRKNSPNLDSH